ncbi:hypothetical protein LTR12_006313 [Friedmanniomyces endolithicus]|nr:hypothetical protein LTR12_006313 [Friedmanniomyces endolithicus]
MGAKNFPWQLMEAARHAVVILHENFDIPDEQRHNIFKHAFLEEAQALRPSTDIKMYSLSDAYNCRLRSDRKPWWITHNGDRPNEAESARRNAVRATALERVQTAALPSDEPTESGDEDVMDGYGTESLTGAEIVQDVAEADSTGALIDREGQEQDGQRAVDLSEDLSDLGRFASWPMAELLDGMSINLETPAYSDLLEFCRTHARKRKLSIVQYLERRLNQAGSKRAKAAAQRSGQPTLASPDSDAQPDAREEVDDSNRRVSIQKNITRKSIAEASLTQAGQHPNRLSEGLLKMVHYRDCIWQATSPRCHTGRYVNSTSDIYKAGGKVFRTSINNKLEDVMICQMSTCNYCITGNDGSATNIADTFPRSRDVAANVVNGRPFVHNGDVTLDGRGMPRYFKGTSSGWSPDFPEDMYPSVVDFTVDGVTVEKVAVIACYARKCDVCGPRAKGRANKRQKTKDDMGEARRKVMVAEEAEEMTVRMVKGGGRPPRNK